MVGIGPQQRRIRRCFIDAKGAPVPTSTLLRRCYPGRDKLERWRWNDVARAAHKFAVNIKRGWWAPNAKLAEQLSPKKD
jgi:hypothetical protein